jgi:hypothetical protein
VSRLIQLARIACVLEREFGFVGLAAKCEALLESDPKRMLRVVGDALQQVGRGAIARAKRGSRRPH